LRAAGVIDKKFPAQARETLQIAAIHQLRSFLRGDYGESFRRPAWELLRAQLLASSERVDMKAISTRLDERQRGHEENPADPLWSPKNIREIIDKAKGKVGDKLGKDGVARAERAVIREDWARIFRGFRGSLPLIATCFDGIDLPAGALLASRDLSRCTFVGADLRWARLDGANLWGARLDGAILYEARLDGADLSGARLDGANLSGARLDGAILIEARLDGANLSGARLDGADLSGARLDGANLSGARLDGANLFQARLDGAELSWVPLQGAILVEARLDGAVLRWSGLQGADLTGARLDGADLSGARLGGADLSGARLDGADLAVARLDKKTVLAFDWEELSEEERETYRKPWRDAGAIFVQKVTRKNGKVKEVFF
ncbi:MAG: pentapeptide repeat-containing protein, partial [Sphingomonas sp.]